ncbi:MAG: ABC transporter ATP-binding protein [Acidilobaceae archaeon]
MSLLTVEGLNAGYGKFHILFDISLNIEEKEILAIVGPNGSGKSTLLKAITGIADVYSGRITFKGSDITRLPPHVKARMGLAYLPQTDNVFTNLSVWENLKMAAYTLDESIARDRIEEVLSYYPILRSRLGFKARSLSGGERQILALAMTLIRKPEIIMLDEPTGNLAPIIAKDLLKKIQALREDLGKTIILVEQNAKAALEISDKALLLVSGRIEYSGFASKLLADTELSRKYLGLR